MNVEIANKLVKLRKQMGLSQEELAEKIGVSRQAVSKWERSESSPDTDNLIALSRIYGISIDEMLDPGTESPVNKAKVEITEDESSYDDVYDDGNPNGNNFKAGIPMLITMIYLALGLIWGLWHPGWLVFLLIPVIFFLIPEKTDGKWTMKKQIRKIPYPILATFIFLLLGFAFNGWAWSWLIFMTIPVWVIVMKNTSPEKK